jgi:hypothetical protein
MHIQTNCDIILSCEDYAVRQWIRVSEEIIASDWTYRYVL